ncbi:hypothetical protein RDABS01_018736 [Bienertia sinuspersici]
MLKGWRGFEGGADSMKVVLEHKYTWQRGLEPQNLIRERLDRFLADDEWHTLFSNAQVKHFPIYKSDHAPILMWENVSRNGGRRRRTFHFEAMWLSNEGCKEVIQKAWSDERNKLVVEKINHCATRLSEWAEENFGDIKRKIKMKEKELKLWQESVPDGMMMEKCTQISSELDELHRLEETYWHARSRANELRDGDKNTSYFHHKASQRRRRNRIVKLEDEQGVVHDREEGMSMIINNYFTNLFTSSWPMGEEEALAGLSCLVSEEMNNSLLVEPTEVEIKEALFQMHPNKAPGPDGMHALFYQKCWNIVKGDVVKFIGDWWHGRANIQEVNKTCIVLVPKCQQPQRMGEFCPISLCNVVYKIISKLLANRLKTILPNLISDHQSAFVRRLITDNVLVAFEIFHAMKRRNKGKEGIVAMKLDMSKAYDRVEWSFLEQVMKKMGFGAEWIRRVIDCVASVSYSVKWNGKVEGNIIPSRGLKQGDPISPYLFLLCAEAFISLLTKATEGGRIHGARVCREAPRVSHLFFADDSILFTRATLQECSTIAEIISLYERASG